MRDRKENLFLQSKIVKKKFKNCTNLLQTSLEPDKNFTVISRSSCFSDLKSGKHQETTHSLSFN